MGRDDRHNKNNQREDSSEMKRIVISLIALMGLVLFSGCGGEKKEAAAPAPAVETVKPAEPAAAAQPAAAEAKPAAADPATSAPKAE
jgi:hypothetical protein